MLLASIFLERIRYIRCLYYADQANGVRVLKKIGDGGMDRGVWAGVLSRITLGATTIFHHSPEKDSHRCSWSRGYRWDGIWGQVFGANFKPMPVEI